MHCQTCKDQRSDTGSCYSEQDVLRYFDVQRDGFHHLPHTQAHSHLQCARCLWPRRRCAGGYRRNTSDRNSGQRSPPVQRSVVGYKGSEVLQKQARKKWPREQYSNSWEVLAFSKTTWISQEILMGSRMPSTARDGFVRHCPGLALEGLTPRHGMPLWLHYHILSISLA